MLKNDQKLVYFSVIISLLNFLLFHFPFFGFVLEHVEYQKFHGLVLIISLVLAMLVANFFATYLLFFLLRFIGKYLFVFFFITSAIALYFVTTYSVIIDESMIGNVFNTKYEEASSYFSFKFIIYIVVLGIVPSIYILKSKIVYPSFKRFSLTTFLSLLFLGLLVFANASNWLWIDKNSKTLGGLAMPWSYTVNTSLYFLHKNQKNEKEILLPSARIIDNEKSVMVLVIGESSRRENFSLYGYNKNTNPLLSQVPNLQSFNATSCATYTTGGVKCILEHTNSKDLYEILPNYLYRNNVDVIWRTTNWGEPPVHIKKYETRDVLKSNCKGEDCDYDGILLSGLKEEIESSKKNKILVILHTSTSHGPTYSKKYPPRFGKFQPVCNSVELGNCTQEELINAYDNTIVYTDYLLNSLINNLKELKGYNSSMLFVSDHGESLGENNLYMHGVPKSMAPKEQYEIPFIVWLSNDRKKYRVDRNTVLSQNNVFHSVLNFLAVDSPIYDSKMSIFK